jgi:4-diphosphocytidyl-2-C-methyl-D-erythritol kinase
MIAALEAGDLTGVARRLYNVFEDALNDQRRASVNAIKNTLIEYGALGAAMSGSGPTVFGLFDDEEKAKEAYQILSKEYRESYLAQSV